MRRRAVCHNRPHMVGLRLAVIFLCSLATHVFADVPVTSYECAPGTQGNGSCTCPKNYSAKRDPADESRAICAASAAKPISQVQPAVGGYAQLVAEGNDAASAMNCTRAEELYVKALAVNPKGVEALVGSGVCMAKQSKWTSAHAQFDRALAINPKHELALWSKAEAYRLNPISTAEAIAAYRAYLAVFPSAAKAKQALKQLGSAPLAERKPPPAKPLRFPKRTQDVVIAISGTKILANGVAVTGNGTVADWIAVYGKPERTWAGGGINKIHTWDRLGFIVYEPTSNAGRASSVTFLYKPMGQAYDPKVMFDGYLLVDGTDYATATTSVLKTKPGATTPYGAGTVVFPKGAFNVFTQGKSETLDLVELAMWKTTLPDAGTPSKTGVRAADVKVEVSKTGVKVQGQEIGAKPMVADFKKLLGEPDRVWKGKGNAVNHIHVWDSLGILVYEPVGSGKAVTLSMLYKPLDTAEFSPKTLFKGRVALETRGVYNFTTIGTLAKREGATQPYGADSVMFDLGAINLFAGSTGTTETVGVVELKFWKK